MRSINYVFGGKPQNLDDCLDLLHREKPKRVSLKLETSEIINEVYLCRHLLGNYLWEFKNDKVEYKEVYGGCFQFESQERQKLSVNNANKRLEDYLSKLKNLKIKVFGEDKRFDYSIIYKEER